MVGLRKLLDKIFSEDELRILDDILPSFRRHRQLDDEDRKVKTILLISSVKASFCELKERSGMSQMKDS